VPGDLALDFDGLDHRRPRHHAGIVGFDRRQSAGWQVEKAANAPIEPEQVDVGDGIAAAHDPVAAAQAVINGGPDRAGRVEALRPGWMDGRSEIGHPRDGLRLGLDVARGQQPGLGMAACQIEEDAGHFDQRPPVDHQDWHLAGRIDFEKVGRARLLLGQRQSVRFERNTDLVQSDMRGHRAGTGGEIEGQHGVSCFDDAF
jgi:hypothetical protein